MVNYSDNNIITLIGTIVSDKQFSHEVYGEGFYTFDLEVPRLSENSDIIPVTASERILDENFKVGQKVIIDGQFRSYNNYENEKNKLVLTVFVREIKPIVEIDTKDPNSIFLDGYICKVPVYRKTPLGREITDLLVAINRPYNKSDYIPSIVWGRNAKFAKNLNVGDRIQMWGRVQSRVYDKKLEGGISVKKTAYEVSVSKIKKVEMEEEE